MFGEWTETDCHASSRNIDRVGNEAKNGPSKDFTVTNETGAGHEA